MKIWSQNIEKMLNFALNLPLKKGLKKNYFLQILIDFWAFLLLYSLVSNIFTTFFRDSEVCIERCNSYCNFGYLEKNPTFLF